MLLLFVFGIAFAIILPYLTSCSKVFPVPAYGPASASASAKAFCCFVVQLTQSSSRSSESSAASTSPLLCSQNKPKTSNIFLRRRSSVFGDNVQRPIDSSVETAVAAHAPASVEPFEAVAWVRIATGGGGGCAWPGFVGVIEADSTDGIAAKGTLKIVQNASKSKNVPEELLADGAVLCACQWEGAPVDLKTAIAVMFETLQDK